MFDVFYSGTKPGVLAHEQQADSIEHAQQLSRTEYFWWITYLADLSTWDWLYVPAPWQADQRHAWPSQHQIDSGIYLVPSKGYTDTNYHTAPVIHRMPDMSFWNIPDWIDPASIDTRWSPDPMEPPYVYEFPVEWGWDNIGGPQYCVPGASEIKYVYDFVAKTKHNPLVWHQHYDFEWSDEIYRWRPIPTDPPYIYVFGNQWYPAEIMPTVEYRVPGATERKYMDMGVLLPKTHGAQWSTLHDCKWDYSWIPDPGDPPYIYVFGNQWHTAEIMPTIEYAVPGATERKYMNAPIAELPENPNQPWYNVIESNIDYSWVPDPGDPPYIYVFGNQWHAAEIMPTVEYRMPGATERKYVDVPVAKLVVDMKLWHVPGNVDITDMDFSWVPDPGSPPYIYQFATQHQKTGGPQYCMPGATEIKYVDMMQAEVTAEAVCIVEIDHLDGNTGFIPNTFKRIRYFDNYRDTLIRLAKSLVGTHEHVWVCSSICDYTDFDFSWHPEKWQSTMLHVFPSDTQKFGDTFYMHVPTFAERAEKKQLLEWYSVNYVSRRPVPRRPMPIIQHDQDSHVDVVRTRDFAGPLAVFTQSTYMSTNLVTVPLWREQTKTIVPLNPGASSVVVPKTAIPYIKTQLYDYPYIDKTHRMLKDPPQDIVFISNGEPNAKQNFKRLTMIPRDNRLVEVSNINGRAAAYHAAARASTTPWFFAVFAKLEVDIDFDFTWQPDRMQEAKHYIFHAKNPCNGLVYGHQAMIAYNRQLVLNNPGVGLDFTLDSPHEVVPILSGQAQYNTSAWSAWRTAFREVLKLKASLPDLENEYRLNIWLSNTVEMKNANWSQWGAEDAVEYYDEVDGDFAALKKSYEWDWLASYAFMKRSVLPSQ